MLALRNRAGGREHMMLSFSKAKLTALDETTAGIWIVRIITALAASRSLQVASVWFATRSPQNETDSRRLLDGDCARQPRWGSGVVVTHGTLRACTSGEGPERKYTGSRPRCTTQGRRVLTYKACTTDFADPRRSVLDISSGWDTLQHRTDRSYPLER